MLAPFFPSLELFFCFFQRQLPLHWGFRIDGVPIVWQCAKFIASNLRRQRNTSIPLRCRHLGECEQSPRSPRGGFFALHCFFHITMGERMEIHFLFVLWSVISGSHIWSKSKQSIQDAFHVCKRSRKLFFSMKWMPLKGIRFGSYCVDFGELAQP